MAAFDTANTETEPRVFGDADGNGELNAKDIAMILRYIVEDEPSGFQYTNADVTEDGTVDLKDLLAIRKRMTELESADNGSTHKIVSTVGKPSTGNTAEKTLKGSNQGQQPSQPLESVISSSGNSGDTTTTTTYYQVTFALGSGQDSINLPDAKPNAAGTRIDTRPSPVRQDVIFLGWYYDAALTQPVGDSDTVDRNMTLYAKTDSLAGLDIQETPNYITVTDVEPEFQLQLSGTDIDPADLIIIQVSANNAEVPFTVDSNGNVTITGGWENGHTYKAVLKDDSSAVFVHEGQPQQTSIRVFNIIVKKAPVQNLSLNDAEGGLKYIPRTDIPTMSNSMQGLFTASLKAGNVGETTIDKVEQTGTFTYSGSETLSVGDVVAVYEGRHPNERETDEEREASIIYVEITEVSGTTYSYKTADAEDVLFIPDVLPVNRDKMAGGSNTLTLTGSELDFSGPDFADMGLNSDTTIDEGDFLAFYDGSLEDGSNLTYGKITSVQENKEDDTYTITYADVSESEVYASMDIYLEENREIKLTDEQIREIEQDILTQAVESGFVDEAAEYLTALALETDGFQELAEDFDIQNYAITFDDGTPVDEYGLSLMADSGRAQITKKEIKPTVHIGELDHFEDNKGIRVELNMELEITVDLGKDRSIVIDLSAVFEQEVMLSVNTSGGAIWKKKWIFPYIADYRLNANLDMGTYTGIGITATAQTKGKDDEKFDWGMSTGNSAGDKIIDIGKQIKELMDKKDKFLNYDLVGGKDDDDDDDDDGIPISGGLEEKYAAMIKEADESWIDIFRTEIFSQEGHVDPYCILCYGIKADFVVGASFYVTMGMTFTYEVAKRYNFSILLFARECTNDTIDLKAPEYEFTFYVMGTMGIRAGVEFEVGVGLFSLKLDSIGITAGAGVYVQMWGYFFYDLKGVKNSDTGKFEKTSQYSGAMLFEIGVYLKITFKAQLFSSKKLTYQPTLYENYWPFFTVGERENVLGFAEKDDDGNEIQTEYDMYAVRTLTLPSSLFSMRYLDMITGEIGGDEDENETTKVTEMKAGKNWDDETESHFTIEMSDSRYTYNPADNTVTVNPGGLSFLPDCEMTIRWKSGTLAFSSEPIERKVIIRWSDPANVRYIAFDSQGGSPVRQIIGDPGMAITLPKDPGKKGYDFGGWYTDSACSTPFALTVMPENFNGEKGTTVYAKWIPRNDTPYTVEHYQQELNGTYTLADTDRLTGTTDSNAAVTCKTSGVYAHFQPQGVPAVQIVGNGTTVVRVYYNRKNYTIEFTYGMPDGVNADAIPAAKTYTAKYGATVYAPLLALRGYEMAGFSGVPESGGVVVTGDASYEAQWTAGQADYRVEHYSPRISGDGYILSGEDAVQKKTALSG
ncbi:MAG: InlB B-repeat-containing protein, partial [Acetatifactor sp.]|nr:InlB B-repeat-containing protein [Acetatifactor sp.]